MISIGFGKCVTGQETGAGCQVTPLRFPRLLPLTALTRVSFTASSSAQCLRSTYRTIGLCTISHKTVPCPTELYHFPTELTIFKSHCTAAYQSPGGLVTLTGNIHWGGWHNLDGDREETIHSNVNILNSFSPIKCTNIFINIQM